MLGYDSYKLVINKLLAMVEDGTLKPNEKIYSENQLARILNIPRSQVREVYSALNILGILHGEQGKGTFFCSNLAKENTQILYLMTLMEESKLEDVVEMRRVLEIGALRLTIKNCTEEDLIKLRNYAQITIDSQNYIELAEADEKFHFTIIDLTDNALLKYNYNMVRRYISRVATDHWQQIISNEQKEVKENFAKQHMDLVDAIENKDIGEACNLMNEHFNNLMLNVMNKDIEVLI